MTMETRTVSSAQQMTGTANWLQIFSEPAPVSPSATPGATPVPTPAPQAPAVATPGATPVNPNVTPLVGQLPGQQPAQTAPAPAPAPTPAPAQEPVMLDFGGRKLPDTPENRLLHQDWKNQTAALTRANQELLRYKQTPAPAPQPAPTPAPAPQPAQTTPAATANDVLTALNQGGLTTEQFQTMLYGDDPLGAVARVAQAVADQIVQQRLQSVQPVLQRADQFAAQYEMNQRIATFSAQHPDFEQVLPQMVPLFDQYKELNSLPNGVEIAYNMAKGMAAQPAAPAPTVQDLLKDETARAQILQDPAIRDTIIQEHLRKVSTAAPSAPVMAGPVAAAAPTLPASTPATLGDATKRLLARLGAQGGQP